MMGRIGRRAFLAMCAACAGPIWAQSRPNLTFPKEPRERLAVSTYPFRSVIGRDKMSLAEFAQVIKPRLGVFGIEPWSDHFESTNPDYVHGLHASFKQAGVRVVNIPVDADAGLCGTEEQREAGLHTYHNWANAAVILGSPSIRVHLPHGESGDQISCSVSALRELANYGASKNIVINLENDEPDIEQPERIAKVIRAIDSPFLRALPDFCNSMLVHNDSGYNYQAMRLLFGLAYNISHVKDEESDEGKTYRVDVNHIFPIAKKAGYTGFFSMEWEGTGDAYEGTTKLIEASVRNLS